MEEYMRKKRKELEAPDTQYLLVTVRGKKLYPKYIYRSVRKYLAQVTTIEKKSPHVLRHVRHPPDEPGRRAQLGKELLGHASLAATQVYTHNTIEKLKDVYKKPTKAKPARSDFIFCGALFLVPVVYLLLCGDPAGSPDVCLSFDPSLV